MLSRKIRVLIVDDSAVIRRLLSNTLQSEDAIEVASTAPNGKIALAKIPQVNPDVVTLDMEMPEMDGIQTLEEIRKRYPDLPVIMFSSLTQRSAEATLIALSKGANDYVAKPAKTGGVGASVKNVREDLVPKIKCHCRWYAKQVQHSDRLVKFNHQLETASERTHDSRVDIITIGVSTGGPDALQKILPALPSSLPVPIVLVQHMPAVFTKYLADRLDSLAQLRVREAQRGDRLSAGGVWIAPGDYHMTLQRAGTDVLVALNQSKPENSCRPAVDVLFRSAAKLYGKHVYSIVLTGMGQDGVLGCSAVRAAGGRIHVQDENSSVVWGMPGAVVSERLASKILPLDRIAPEIVRQTKLGRRVPTCTIGV